ncbi:hypothetical protein C8T65DRAFT_635732 [Cerioporus squamosus]|nr:hypothetical protein C8T65DRAFT_635732 [Cerioporus squamosus]
MSHLTAPMPPQAGHHLPQKPYLFDLPRPAHPLTPPDTDYEMPHQTLPAQNITGLETEPLPPHMPPSMLDSPYASPYATLHRKRPSVTYVNSSVREARERVVQRGLKWLVVVIPPISFTREHGHLGHTLSSGPSRRLSSGILMPLYPTLNSQLGAIAREFQFPSIHGLCVYLQTTHGGVALSPRVSDDTWPLLWSHLFDARSPSLPVAQLPISGQIEFDIDMTKARWYDSWLASSRREYADVPQSVAPSRPQSLSHWRADSQGSINEPADDQTDVISLAPQNAARATGRNIKKLSLLDRFDGASVRSGSKLVPRDESPPSHTARQGLTQQALSPIVQEDEPATAKKDIDHRVRSWRMSATAAARSPMAATGQTSLDPVNMPNTIEDLPTASASEFELNLDDYTWSVSSVGPPEYDMESVYSWDRVPSVHMDRRGEGSVCLTASVCTSFGPDDDYEPLSPISYMSRLPSPDIAWRMFEDVPPTPTTATSWGAPSEYPPSPAAFSTAPSIDIAGRFLASRPVTPTTATSWGAPSSYPPSPVLLSRVPSPDLGWRAADSAPNSPRFRRRTAEAGQPYNMVYPYYNPAQSHNLVFPYYDAAHASSWQHVWPYTERNQQVQRMSDFVFPPPAERKRRSEAREAPGATLGYPVLDIYPAVYPSFDIYPALLTLDDRKLGAPAVNRGAAYPIFDLYPAVYPSLNIYPPALTIAQSGSKELPTALSSSYPNLEPYPAVYPHLTIYPTVHNDSRNIVTTRSSVRRAPGYPVFDIYPAVYHRSPNNAYPAVNVLSKKLSSVQVQLSASYPIFDIYPSVYPYCLDKIYPAIIPEESSLERSSVVAVGVEWQYPIFDIYPSLSDWNASVIARASREVVVTLSKAYPVLEIYPPAYPWSVYDIYPEVPIKSDRADGGIDVTLPCCYPVFNIYPAVYPYSLDTLYPPTNAYNARGRLPAADMPSNIANKVANGHARKPSWKRGLPPVPPLPRNAHTMRPMSAISGLPLSSARIGRGVTVELPSLYPNICPYPPVYPHLVIYPTVASEDTSINVELAGKVPAVSQYPHLVIYPAVYPFIEVYPSSWGPATRSTITSATKTRVARKPRFTHAELVTQLAPVHERRKPKYSHMELRAEVFAEVQATARIRTSDPVPSPTRSHMRTSMPPPPAPAPARPPPPVPTFAPVRAPSPARAPSPPRARATSRSDPPVPAPTAALPRPPRRPAEMNLRDEDHPNEHMAIPTIVAVEPSPTGSDADPASPLLFEMVTAPAPAPASPAPAPGLVRSRSRSGTVSATPVSVAPSTPPRPLGARPISTVQPLNGDVPPVAPTQRSLNRMSGLPSHPAVNRRISSAGPRPMSTFGPLPSTPDLASAPSASPVVRRQTSMMSPLAEEGRSPINGRSPQLPSPPEEWHRGFRTPTDASSPASASPLSALRSAELNRSKTMPTRAAPRGPRSSTLISERARAFDNPNVIPNREGPLKLSMLDEFPAPPLPSLPSASPITPTQRPVSRLDRSKYPFA